MASTYVNDLRLNEMATGDGSGTWGTTTNTNLELIAEAFSYGTEAITTNADTHTTTIADGATDPGRSMYLKYTGTLDSACTITIGPNTVSKLWFIENATSGSQNIILSCGSGANITILPGDTKVVYSDGAGAGAAFIDAFASLSVVDLIVGGDIDLEGSIDVNGTTNLDIVDIDGAVNMATTALVTGVLTTTATQVATGGITSGSDIISDTDSTDSLGSTGVRWLKGWFDTLTAGTLTIGSGSVTDSSGAISFGDENLTTTGIVTAAGTSVFTNLDISGDIDVDGTTNLDVVDIDGAVDMASTALVTGVLTANGGAVFNETGADVDFRVESDTVDHALFVQGSDGFVGIGTSSPTSSLTTQADSGVLVTDSSGLRQIEIVPPQTSNSFVGEIGTRSSHPLVFTTVNAERVRIDSSGNVGIGTTSPQNKLHVNAGTGGGVTLEANAGVDIDFRYRSNGVNKYNVSYDASAGSLIWYDNTANATRMALDSSGRLGIGTTSPEELLHVNKDSAGDVVLSLFENGTNAAATSASIQLRNHTDVCSTVLSSYRNGANFGADFIVKTSNGSDGSIDEVFRITESGNVGIGTTSPSTKLQVQKGGNGEYLRIGGDDESDGNRGLRFTSSSSASFVGAVHDINAPSSQGVIALSTYSTERLRIDADGNVLVGKTSNDLAVNGVKLGTTGVNVTRNNDVMVLNRTSSDGLLLGLWKDGTAVGSIGVGSNQLIIDASASNLVLENSTRAIAFSSSAFAGSGSGNDAVIDLGISNRRFKDLYLSGGVYLGGTGAANLLDDYEEGTWTAELKGSTASATTPVTETGTYTKVGNVVTVHVGFANVTTTGASGSIQVIGLPFTNTSANPSAVTLGQYTNLAHSANSNPVVYINASANLIQGLQYNNSAVPANWFITGTTGVSFYVSATYTI
jgi:hypothetical protein